MSAKPLLDPEGFNQLRATRSGPLLYNRHDIYVGGSVAKYGEFSWAEQELFRQVVVPGTVLVEVGANIGAHTVYLAQRVGAAGTVHAFEPQRLVFQNLCANLALNQLTNVFAYQMALGDQTGTLLVPPMDPNTAGNFGGVTLRGVTAGEPVPLSMLDNLQLPACHFIKADVEGMEVEVINGAVQTIDRHRPVLFLENDRRDRSAELITLVSQLDYDMYWNLAPLFNPDNFAREAEDIFNTIVSINVLCCPKERSIVVNGMRKVAGPDDWWKNG
ncbi:MAG: FkbM family methyltransferase [Casimicrobiaceae bacterium]